MDQLSTDHILFTKDDNLYPGISIIAEFNKKHYSIWKITERKLPEQLQHLRKEKTYNLWLSSNKIYDDIVNYMANHFKHTYLDIFLIDTPHRILLMPQVSYVDFIPKTNTLSVISDPIDIEKGIKIISKPMKFYRLYDLFTEE